MDVSNLSLAGDDLRIAFSSLLEDTSCPVSIFDANGFIVASNGAYAAARGEDPNALVGKHLDEVVGPEVSRTVIEVMQRAIDSGSPLVAESIYQGDKFRTTFRPISPAADGTARVLVVSPTVFTTSHGRSSPTKYPTVAIDPEKSEPLASLTERELEVLKLIGEGLSTAEIAETLHRSIKTIEGHRASIGKKLHVTNRVELARLAIRAGITRLGADADGTPG